MRRLILAGLVCAAALLAGGPGRRGLAEGRPGDPAALRQALGLTDDQVRQLRGLRREQASAARPAVEQMRENARALREAMAAPNPDPAQVGRMAIELKGLREQARASRTALNGKALAVLTPDQKTKLAALDQGRESAPALHQAVALGLLAPRERMSGARLRRAPAPGVQ